jgi:hypothetical protein
MSTRYKKVLNAEEKNALCENTSSARRRSSVFSSSVAPLRRGYTWLILRFSVCSDVLKIEPTLSTTKLNKISSLGFPIVTLDQELIS